MAHLRIPSSWEIPERLTTPEEVFLNRRQLLAALGLGALAFGLPAEIASAAPVAPKVDPAKMLQPAVAPRFAMRFPAQRNPAYKLLAGRTLTPEAKCSGYNNFYEMTTIKDEVWKLAAGYPVVPWKVEVTGLVAKPRTYDLDDLFKFPLEERIYRHRCVERWAMQVPWTGFPLKALLDQVQPLSTAKYLRSVSFSDPEHLPGVKETISYYPWPYHEGLRLDEAMNPLAFIVLGSYGHPLPMQNGAPLRLHCPWKYGYKSPKSIVKLELLADPPPTFWHALQPVEYGFYSNVNPKKPHPRWSQEIEEDLGTGEKRQTLLYNGYGEQVARMYKGDEA